MLAPRFGSGNIGHCRWPSLCLVDLHGDVFNGVEDAELVCYAECVNKLCSQVTGSADASILQNDQVIERVRCVCSYLQC